MVFLECFTTALNNGEQKKYTRVADRAFRQIKVSWRQPGHFWPLRAQLSHLPIRLRIAQNTTDFWTEVGHPLQRHRRSMWNGRAGQGRIGELAGCQQRKDS